MPRLRGAIAPDAEAADQLVAVERAEHAAAGLALAQPLGDVGQRALRLLVVRCQERGRLFAQRAQPVSSRQRAASSASSSRMTTATRHGVSAMLEQLLEVRDEDDLDATVLLASVFLVVGGDGVELAGLKPGGGEGSWAGTRP